MVDRIGAGGVCNPQNSWVFFPMILNHQVTGATLPETSQNNHEKMACSKGKCFLPTIHFQVRAVSFREAIGDVFFLSIAPWVETIDPPQ